MFQELLKGLVNGQSRLLGRCVDAVAGRGTDHKAGALPVAFLPVSGLTDGRAQPGLIGRAQVPLTPSFEVGGSPDCA